MVTPEGIRARIAVVDDERMLLQVFSSLMRQYRYHADFFSNPLTAISAILQDPGKYNLVLSDIRMPQMDGIAFARKIRESLPDMPFMFMTGEVTEEVKREAMSMGNVAFLEKPFPLEPTLKEVIPKFLGLQTF